VSTRCHARRARVMFPGVTAALLAPLSDQDLAV
jgi:hypothetical protein